MEVDIEIDGLTNCLVNRATGEECDTQYRLISKTITKADAQQLMQEGWLFDWSIPHSNGYEIYELLIKGSEERHQSTLLPSFFRWWKWCWVPVL